MKGSLKTVLTMLLLGSTPAYLTQDLNPVIEKSSEITTLAANSQETIDGLADSIDSKFQQFKSINKETDGLKIYNLQMQKQIDSQIQEMKDLNESIDQVSVIERQIVPLMIRMVDGLEDFVTLDVPFLADERAERIASLKAMMAQANVAPSEKFRRVLESYQIEVDYGRTIEAYADVMDINGQEQEVDFLRIGRVAFIYQTKDQNQMGIWDNEVRSWQPLDDKYRSQVTKGLRMARKQLAPDLIVVPVEAPVTASE